jgi:hypothetical protein
MENTPVINVTLAPTKQLIKRLIGELDVLNNQKKENTEELEAGLMFFDDYKAISLVVKDNTKSKKNTKMRLVNDNANLGKISSKIIEIGDDIKMVKESLNTHLLNYYRDTGLSYFEDGELKRSIKFSVKVSPAQMRLL